MADETKMRTSKAAESLARMQRDVHQALRLVDAMSQGLRELIDRAESRKDIDCDAISAESVGFLLGSIEHALRFALARSAPPSVAEGVVAVGT